MLDVLFGSKNVEKVLLFLFVNGKCYGSQLGRLLDAPLTPIQKALLRLEKGGVVMSYFEGKTRVYKFNPAFPLLSELEPLLKRAYMLLSPSEKKQYCSALPGSGNSSSQMENSIPILLAFWKQLSQVTQMSFNARSRSKEESGWNGRGRGEVVVSKQGDTILLFHEKGSWKGIDEREIDFSNVFRWTYDRGAGLISLEHLRRGPDAPVFLFHLAPSGSKSLSSVGSHLCEKDMYFGQIFSDPHALRLNWRVIGPKKNEEIDYYYA